MWTIEDHERAALAQAQKDNFREDVVDHVLAKLQLPEADDAGRLRENVRTQYDNADTLLGKYPNATYKSYVFMTLIYSVLPAEVMASKEPWTWLENDRVGINTRVELAYHIMRDAMKEGN